MIALTQQLLDMRNFTPLQYKIYIYTLKSTRPACYNWAFEIKIC